MASQITFDSILSGKDYDPRPGLEYQIADSCVVKMLTPTVGKHKAAFEAIDNDESLITSVAICTTLVSGEMPASANDCHSGMLQIVVSDFFSLVNRIMTRLQPQSDASTDSDLTPRSE